MKRVLLSIGLVVTLTHLLRADSNLKIIDVGLHGYLGTPTAVRLQVRNPFPQAQVVRIQVTVREWTWDTAVTRDLNLDGGEERAVELPVLMPGGEPKFKATATAGGKVIGSDSVSGIARQNLIALMCDAAEACKTLQSQIQFSGSVEDRADKNRGLRFEVVHDFREDWWGYSAANAVVLATSLTKLQPEYLLALEGYLRRGGRLVLVEQAIADPDFLASYRKATPDPKGQRVGKGLLFRVPTVDKVGDAFAGHNLLGALNGQDDFWFLAGQMNWMMNRYATTFYFPRPAWLLVWLAIYIVVIGVLNFFVLRRLRLLEYGWISTCALALVFAAGFYLSSASRRPKAFRLDNLATYFMDANSGLAAADYNLRLSTPDRRDVMVSINDPAVLITTNLRNQEGTKGQIWAEINRDATRVEQEYDIDLGPPQKVELPMLKWSFRDLDLRGLREFPGTVHFVAPNRLRNDTGQRFSETLFVDYDANKLYPLPALAPGEEVGLETITPTTIRPRTYVFPDQNGTLEQMAISASGPFTGRGRIFAAITDGPALPVELNVQYVHNAHSLIVVSMGQP